ncbi:T-complex protein 1 subunit theta [Nematocida displodere]|uniref:T-complex protein 1 subunit theta n=1 Tax=Nematocida displodere TaxID=1805483 RepID=A0A177ED50_9MICR|nr:T-complex protein 1 subunit theta [Nematocida displodere]
MNSAFGGQSLMRTKTAETSGVSCVLKNIDGIVSLCDIVKSSYGIHGAYKLVVNSHQKTVISRSVSSILSGCDIEHPALRMLVEPIAHLAQMGDCTGFLMGVIGEILRRSGSLISQGVLPMEISSGLRECLEEVRGLFEEESEKAEFSLTDQEVLRKVLSGIVKEKRVTELLAESIASISQRGSFPIDSVRVAKVNVGSLSDSERFQGMLLETGPAGSVEKGENLKTAIYTCPLAISNMETKGTVLLKNAEDLLTYTSDDEATVRNFVDRITANGVGLLICNGTVDSLMLDFLNEKGVIVLKVTSKFELRRLCMLFGGKFSNTLTPIEEGSLGRCSVLEVCAYGERRYTRVLGAGRVDTIIIKGSLPARLEEHERVIGKATCALQVVANESMRTGSIRLLKGAGICEKNLSKRIREIGEQHTDMRQVAMKILAESIHSVGERCLSESIPESSYDQVYDVAAIKERALTYALVLSSDILSISQMFITTNEDTLQAPKRPGNWDDLD